MIPARPENAMPRRKRKKTVIETPVDYRAPGFDPNTLLGSAPKGPLNYEACLYFAERDSAPHQNRVAEYHLEGRVVERNAAEAVAWFELSAEQGNPHALRRLGDLYRNGIGVAVNPTRAFEYYREGAEMEHHPSIYELGRCYEEGFGCVSDIDKARDMYQQAVEIGGNQKARARLKELAKPKRKTTRRTTIQSKMVGTAASWVPPPVVPVPVTKPSARTTTTRREEQDWAPFVGTCGLHMTVGEFISGREERWLELVCTTVSEMFPNKKPLKSTDNNRTVRSYRETISALVKELGNVCCSYPEFCELEVALEYVIPGERSDPDNGNIFGLRADAVIFSTDRVAILEFKTGKSVNMIGAQIAEAIGQVNDYMRGLNRWHRHATPQNLRACAVFFALKNHFELAEYPIRGFEPAVIVSQDYLYTFLNGCFVGHCVPVTNPHQWLHSFVPMGMPHENIFHEVADYAAEHFDEMAELDGNEKAAIRRRIARRLSLPSPKQLKPLIAALTNGQWQLRDAVVQQLEGLPQDQLETLFIGWRDQE